MSRLIPIPAHVKRAPIQPKLVCVKCDKFFRGRKGLARHVIKHHTEKKS